MRIIETIKYACAWVACLGVLSPAATFGTAPAAQSAPATLQLIQDVELSDGGTMTGRVVDQQGNGVAGVTVTLMQHGQQVAQSASAATGAFAIDGLAGGTFQVVSGNKINSYRVWAAKTAPPVATKGVLLVVSQPVVRGQQAAGQPYYGEMVQGQAMPAQPVPGQPVPGQMVQGQVVQGQPMYPAAGQAVYGQPAYGPPACGCGDPGCGGGCGGVAGGGGYGFLANPWIVGAVVAAAIAIPLALDDDDDGANLPDAS